MENKLDLPHIPDYFGFVFLDQFAFLVGFSIAHVGSSTFLLGAAGILVAFALVEIEVAAVAAVPAPPAVAVVALALSNLTSDYAGNQNRQTPGQP